jgi:Mrp family chromosome partitioning ATPase
LAQDPAKRPLRLADKVVESKPQPLHPGAAPGLLLQRRERTRPFNLPPEFIDRCRRAFHSIEFGEGPRVVGITSALYGDGKTSIAVGMTTAVAVDTGEPTVLVEMDLQHPAFDRIFAINQSPGLADWVGGEEHLRSVRMAPLDNAFVVPAGDIGADPARVFYQLSQTDFVEQLKQDYQNIIIDLPPMLSIAYSTLASRIADRILVVARYGVTPIRDIEQVVHLMGHERLSGLVLNGYASRIPVWLRRLF